MTDPDIQKTTALLRKLKPGFLPYPIFEQVARLVALSIIEFVPLRTVGGVAEVLLLQRAADDPLWPGALHTPGTIIRATDLSPDKYSTWPAFQRILHDELRGTAVSDPHYVGSLLNKSKRGVEQAQLYWVEVLGEPKIGDFYPLNNLPADLIKSQLVFIQEAARHDGRHYLKFKK